jgi:hypothetical protein
LNETKTNRILGNVAGEIGIIDGLKLKVLFGVDILDNKQNRYLPSTTAEGQALSGLATVGSVFTTNWLNENTLSYDRNIGLKGKVNALLGFTAQQSNSEGTVAEAQVLLQMLSHTITLVQVSPTVHLARMPMIGHWLRT